MGRLALPAGQRPQRFRAKQGNIAYASGVTTPLQISQTDYLTSLDLMSNQTVTTTTTAIVAAAGWAGYGALGNVQVKVNGGRAPYSMPGFHTNIYNQIWNHDYVDSLMVQPVTISTTNNWKNHLRIPLTVDPMTEKGCWYTGDTQLNLSFTLTMTAAAVILSTVGGATIGGSWDVWSEKFSAPAPDEPSGWLDEISYYKQVELYSTTTLSNGTTTLTLETDQDWIRLILIFYTGSNADATFAPADALYTNMSLIVNDKFRIFDTIDEQTMRFEQLQTYDRLLPAGTAVFDFLRLNMPPARRDILPTDPDKAKRLQLSILSTSASNKVDVISETVMDSQFAERWIRSAKAKGKAA